ncbi:MAG: alcohol dehydrogenase catalytic domain-containing protein [Actinobacteria bacterium]|nr:alcohol dehydrogenase catalytic domain-containing protein [Chloroflexota bacterium]MCL5291968.1 alcohol dehydrogenase catalytic domain-containing protein [Actinomycetota bacterium]
MFAIGLKRGLEGIQRFEVEKPSIQQEKQVLVRVIETGIDGTDRHVVGANRFEPPGGEDFFILGHEAVGQVEEVGPAVRNLKVGDIVVPTVRRGCGLCAPCLHNMSDYCETGLFTERGIDRHHGYFTEYFADEEDYIVKVPEGVERLAVLTEPISINEKAIAEIRHIQERLPWACAHHEHRYDKPGWTGCKSALVIGAGSLGLLGLSLLRLDGMHAYVAEVAPEESLRVKLAKDMGARYINSKVESSAEIVEITGNLDIILEAAGATRLALELIPALGKNGVYVLTGIPQKEQEVCLDGSKMLRDVVSENQVVFGSVNSNRRHFEMALEHLPSLLESFGPIFSKFITDRYPITEYKKAFEAPDKESVKAVFEVSGFEKRVEGPGEAA